MNESPELNRYQLSLGYKQVMEIGVCRVELEDMQSGEYHVNIYTDTARGHVFCDNLTNARRAYAMLRTVLRREGSPLDRLKDLEHLGLTHIHNYN